MGKSISSADGLFSSSYFNSDRRRFYEDLLLSFHQFQQTSPLSGTKSQVFWGRGGFFDVFAEFKTLHQSQKSMQMLVDLTSTKISDSDK